MLLPADIFNDFDSSAEAGGGATGLSEARKAQVCTFVVFQDDEKLDDEGHRFEVETYNIPMSA